MYIYINNFDVSIKIEQWIYKMTNYIIYMIQLLGFNEKQFIKFVIIIYNNYI